MRRKTGKRRLLLLSGYDANSHRYWREALVDYLGHNAAEWEVTTLSLSPRFFHWRMRGNAMIWAESHRETLEQSFDLLLATSMVDLATLRGLVPSLCLCPNLLYFHENQFEYPLSAEMGKAQKGGSADSVAAMMVQLYSALAADRLLFNSDFNRRSFISGVSTLLAKLPDQVPSNIDKKLAEKAQVLPVPLLRKERGEAGDHGGEDSASAAFEILWNHRWEYDKGPDNLLLCLQALPPQSPVKFHVVGQSFRKKPACFDDIYQLLSERGWLGEWGYVECPQAYQRLLVQSDCVLSTSLHDFQGLSVLEAVERGCIPVVPDRLAYPEFIPAQFRYGGDDQVSEARQAAELIVALLKQRPSAPDLTRLYWDSLGSRYLNLLECAV